MTAPAVLLRRLRVTPIVAVEPKQIDPLMARIIRRQRVPAVGADGGGNGFRVGAEGEEHVVGARGPEASHDVTPQLLVDRRAVFAKTRGIRAPVIAGEVHFMGETKDDRARPGRGLPGVVVNVAVVVAAENAREGHHDLLAVSLIVHRFPADHRDGSGLPDGAQAVERESALARVLRPLLEKGDELNRHVRLLREGGEGRCRTRLALDGEAPQGWGGLLGTGRERGQRNQGGEQQLRLHAAGGSSSPSAVSSGKLK